MAGPRRVQSILSVSSDISDPAFRELVPKVVWQKAEYIRQAGNVAVHGNKSPAPEKALEQAIAQHGLNATPEQ